MPSPILWPLLLKLQSFVLLSSLLWWDLETNFPLPQVLMSGCHFGEHKHQGLHHIKHSTIGKPRRYEPHRDKMADRPVWSESSLSAWRKLGSLVTHWAYSEDSDQTGWLPRLIWVFAIRTKKAWVLSHPMNAQRWLWSDWANAQADLCLRWAHRPLCWFCHEAAHISFQKIVTWFS